MSTTVMLCPACGAALKSLRTSSEPEGIRRDMECPPCGATYMVTKSSLVRLSPAPRGVTWTPVLVVNEEAYRAEAGLHLATPSAPSPATTGEGLDEYVEVALSGDKGRLHSLVQAMLNDLSDSRTDNEHQTATRKRLHAMFATLLARVAQAERHVQEQIADKHRILREYEAQAVELRTKLADDAIDAARWRAFLGSQRIRFFGTAGPDATGYAHFGGEFWTLHPDADSTTTQRNREFLIEYADAARTINPKET